MAKTSVITEEFKAIQTALEVLEPLDETQRNFAVSMILTRLGMSEAPMLKNTNNGTGGTGGGSGSNGSGAAAPDVSKVSPKEFLAAKKPMSDLERLVCLAFYLTHARNTPKFKVKDITDLNEEAFGNRFSNPSQTANNAVKQSRLLAPAGNGTKRITVDGEKLVNALPDREAVDRVKAESRQAPKNKGGRKKKKAKRGAAKAGA